MNDLQAAWTKAMRAGALQVALARALADALVTVSEVRAWLRSAPTRRRRR